MGKHATSLTELHADTLWKDWSGEGCGYAILILQFLCTVHSVRANVRSSWTSCTVGCNWMSQLEEDVSADEDNFTFLRF